MSTATQDLELGALLDSSPDPVSRFDRQLRHVYANRATAIANQRPVEDFYGRTMAQLGHAPEVCDFIESHVQRVFIEGKTLTAELLFEGPQGPVWCQCSFAPERDAHEAVQHVIVVSRDITELKTNAQNELKDLQAFLAHQLNNPLTIVGNVLYLLEQDATTTDHSRDLIAMAKEAMTRVSAITERLRSLETP